MPGVPVPGVPVPEVPAPEVPGPAIPGPGMPARPAGAVGPVLRGVGPDDHAALAALGGQAFAVAPTPFDPASRPHLVDDARRVLAEVRGRPVAHAGAWRFGHWLGGRRLPCAGFASVAVAPDHRGGGLGTRVVRELLERVRADGDVLATLYPMNHRFYRGLSFGPSSVRRRDAVPTRELALIRPPGESDGDSPGLPDIRPATPGDVPAVEALVRDRAAAGTGLLDHEDRWAARWAGGPAASSAWVAERDRVVCGALLSSHVPDGDAAPEPAGARFALSVADLLAADVVTEAALWRLLGSDHPVARHVEVSLPPGCLPRLVGEREIAPVSEFTLVSRVLDVAGALLGRGWPVGVSGQVVLVVEDPLWPGNTGAWRLTVADGEAGLDRAAGAPPRAVRLGVGTLSSLLTGWLDPVAAARAGLLPGARERDLATLRRLLAGPAPHTVDFF